MFDLVLKGGRVIDPAQGVDARTGRGVRRRQGRRGRTGPRRRQADARCLRPDRGARTDRSAHACLLGRHLARRRSRRLREGERAHHADRCGLRRAGQPEGLPPPRDRAVRGAHPAVPQHLVRRHLRAVEGDQCRRMPRPRAAQSARVPGCGEGRGRSGGRHQGARRRQRVGRVRHRADGDGAGGGGTCRHPADDASRRAAAVPLRGDAAAAQGRHPDALLPPVPQHAGGARTARCARTCWRRANAA